FLMLGVGKFGYKTRFIGFSMTVQLPVEGPFLFLSFPPPFPPPLLEDNTTIDKTRTLNINVLFNMIFDFSIFVKFVWLVNKFVTPQKLSRFLMKQRLYVLD